jgi:Cdc6-like AAA superfamily ATPase
VFQPYSIEAIHEILYERIVADCTLPKPLFDHLSLSFLSRKIASTSGDVRVALDICRRALCQKQHENSYHTPEDNNNNNNEITTTSSSSSSSSSNIKPYVITVPEIAKTIKLTLEYQGNKVLQTLPRLEQVS